MSFNKLYVALIAFLVLSNYIVDAKKIKKNRRQKDQDDTTQSSQPNVVAYSTFGFNDVSGYDGFIPTSPDYANAFLSGSNQESTTRLYAPAFPSAPDSTGYSANFGSSQSDEQSFGALEEGVVQSGMSQYASNPFLNQNFNVDSEKNKQTNDLSQQNVDESDSPVYGAKIGSRHKNRGANSQNSTDFSVFGGNYDVVESLQDSKPYSGTNINYQSPNGFVSHYREAEEFSKPTVSMSNGVVNYPKVVDFSNVIHHYPTEVDTSKFMSNQGVNSLNTQHHTTKPKDDGSFGNEFNFYNNNKQEAAASQNHFSVKPPSNEDVRDKNVPKTTSYFNQDFNYNYNPPQHKQQSLNTKTEPKKKNKLKPYSPGNYSNDFREYKDGSMKGYGYSTNFSNMSFKYGVSETKHPFNVDEIEPASSNVVDFTNYHYPDSGYTKFKKVPDFGDEDDDHNSIYSYKDKIKPYDYLNKFKNSFTTIPTTTPYWGGFKTNDYSPFRDHPKKHHFSDFGNDDIVTIPKRPKLTYTKPEVLDNKQVDWPYIPHRPHKLNKHNYDWTKEVPDTKYKSEEDLLGLRTHDTSHPSYLPTFQPTNNAFDGDTDFKNLVEKWRLSYMKSKYKDTPVRDYEGYGSEVKPMHVPIPKPYPIEVPHPIIVPVPRPFPVRVPVSRPVAVPVIQEITVPIEKPVPYPVIKNVPYPVEKLIPVPVEKEVTVSVEKPYPVHIPYVRPVFHHTRPHDERELDHSDEDDFQRRPEVRKPSQYKKRPYTTRSRPRRPSRSNQDRNRRRWPDRRRPSPQGPSKYRSRPEYSPYNHRDYEPDVEEENSGYAQYCRKTGKC